jgi:hypothetical protein
LLEKLLLSVLLVTLLPREVLLSGNLLNLRLVKTRDIDLLGCGNNVAGINSSEGNTIDLERAGNEKNALREMVQEDDTLSTETTSEKNENGTRSESRAGS